MFNLENLFVTEENEFLPHPSVKKGEGLKIHVNLDLMTLEYLDNTEKFFEQWKDEQLKKYGISDEDFAEAAEAEKPAKKGKKAVAEKPKPFVAPLQAELINDQLRLDIRYKAIVLAGRPGSDDPRKRWIASWDLVDADGKPVEISYEVVSKWSRHLITNLYEFCQKAGQTDKETEKKTAE